MRPMSSLSSQSGDENNKDSIKSHLQPLTQNSIKARIHVKNAQFPVVLESIISSVE